MKVLIKKEGKVVDTKNYNKRKVAERFINYISLMSRRYRNYFGVTAQIAQS